MIKDLQQTKEGSKPSLEDKRDLEQSSKREIKKEFKNERERSNVEDNCVHSR